MYKRQMLSYSALYTLSMYVFTIINFGTKIEFGTSWGKAILTLTRTDAAQQFGIHDFNQTVVENYTVSYTHLDVYKRQDINKWGDWSCVSCFYVSKRIH